MDWTEMRNALIVAGVPADRMPTDWHPNINLSRADLSRAHLFGANLSGADLSRANLSRANLSEAVGPFTSGSFGRHHAVAAGGFISVGCERHTYEEWLDRYEEIGRANDYTSDEIADYGAWIRLAVARQRRIETADTPTAG